MIRRRRADGLSAHVAAAIEPRDQVREADRVDIEHHGGIGIIADARGIARHQHHVAQPHRVGAEQIGLDAEQIPIATGIMEYGLDAGLLLDQNGERERADMRACPKPIGDADDVDAAALERAGALKSRGAVVAARRQELHRDDERFFR